MRITEVLTESSKICPQCGMRGCTCKPGTCKCKPKPGYPKNIDEAANPAQQAAIAISMKKAGKKPKSVDEADMNRRGFLKGMGAAAVAGATTGTSYGQSNNELNIVQRQYDWQFAEQLGGDKIIKIVPREAGGKVAITARGKYFLMMPYNEIKHTLPSGWNKGPTDIVLMKTPSQILSGNTTQKKDTPPNANSGSVRASNLDRMKQMAEPSESYAGRIKARIKPNITIPSASERLEETGSVTVEIRSSPDGIIISRKIVGSSGFRRLDDAVLRAIDKTDVLPRDVDGSVPPTINISFKINQSGVVESVEQGVAEGENWSKHNNKRVGGMSKKSVSSYRRSHPGSKIQTAVTTKPSKIKKGSKDAKRRKSFCARMRGMKKHNTSAKTKNDPNSNINKSLRRWHCESIEQMQELVMLAEQMLAKKRNQL